MADHSEIRYLIEGIMLHFASGKFFFSVNGFEIVRLMDVFVT